MSARERAGGRDLELQLGDELGRVGNGERQPGLARLLAGPDGEAALDLLAGLPHLQYRGLAVVQESAPRGAERHHGARRQRRVHLQAGVLVGLHERRQRQRVQAAIHAA